MNLKRDIVFRILLVSGIGLMVSGGITLLPNPLSMTWNIFGYRSVCSFAPLSTIACFLGADAVYAIQSHFFGSRRSGSRHSGTSSFFGPILIAIVLLSLAGFAFPQWRKSMADPSSRMQKEIPESEYGFSRGTVPEDPDFPTSTTMRGKADDGVEWIDSD